MQDIRVQKRIGGIFLSLILAVIALGPIVSAENPAANARFKFEVSYPSSTCPESLTGRMFVIITNNDEREPRLQVGRYGPQLFGVDFESINPGEKVVIGGSVLGYPINDLADLPAGEYYVQAVLNKYTKFERGDGHTVWMHMDQWEGQRWNRSPGNFFSQPKKIKIDPAKRETISLTLTEMIPPIEILSDTKYIKRFKIKSELLTAFWGHPIMIGATVLLPWGYDEYPDVYYPTVYQQGHFSSGNPLRLREEEGDSLFNEWNSNDFPRMIAVTIQHPSPYFDDSYAVNSANNGPYGDAIHQELIPEIERRFRCIPKSYARVLTGGSTGGWESFALQVFYPDFYGGTWSFAPDSLDFRNVEGINIYEDKNAFYKQHEWYRVPTSNTRVPDNGEVRLTSKQRNTMELVNGTQGRSGQQLDVWSSVFGPVGEDGYFKPLFDKRTGKIDPQVAQYWKEHFDIRYHMETHWDEIGPKLVDKLHVICGHMDNFYLNVGVYHVEEFLNSAKNPYNAGTVTYGPRGGHGFRPYTTGQLLHIMADHITKYAPVDEDSEAWKYKRLKPRRRFY